MNVDVHRVVRAVSLAGARCVHRLGALGAAGLALLGLSAAIAGAAWPVHDGERAAGPSVIAEPVAAASVAAPLVRADAGPPLPGRAELPHLLARVQAAATEQGLGWPKAEYRMVSASAELPAHVEVRCALKGAYPGVRRFVASILRDVPTLALREFTLGRGTTEAAEIEARLAIAIYLDEQPVRAAAAPAEVPALARVSLGQGDDTAEPRNPFAVRQAPAQSPPPPQSRPTPPLPEREVAMALPPAAPPAPLTPPPPPLQVIGSWRDAAGLSVLMAGPNGAIVAKVGDMLLAEYRVTRITPQEVALQHVATNRGAVLPVPPDTSPSLTPSK